MNTYGPDSFVLLAMRITKAILRTASLSILQHFYREVMGLEAERKDRSLSLKIGRSQLVFEQAGSGAPFYHFAINIPANKIGEARAWMRGRAELLWMEDYRSEIAEFVNWKAQSIYFLDPAGNIVELIARHELHNEESGPFSAEQWLSLSEIGLVYPVNEIDSATKRLLEQFGLSWFSRQPPFPQFKAIGDDEGLFIAVTEHRHWYPTRVPSRIFPLQVSFETESGAHTLTL